jgi:hypothetical protein
MADFIRYANQGATRNQPLSDDLVRAMSFLPELGVEMEVFSGGQPAAGEGARVGSTRHDHGGAADVYFYKDGRRLDWADPDDQRIFEQIVQQGRQAGLTGFGAGEGYMRPGSMHIGFGEPAVWGAGGRGSNAPEWLRNAYNGVASPTVAPPPTALAAANQQAGAAPTTPPNALSAYFAATQGGDSFLNMNPMNFLTANANGGNKPKSGGDIGNGLKIDERTRSLMGSAADGSRGRALAALPVLNTRDDGSVFAHQGREEIEMGSTRKESRRENDAGAVKFVAKSDGRELKPRQVMRKNKDTGKRETVTVYF